MPGHDSTSFGKSASTNIEPTPADGWVDVVWASVAIQIRGMGLNFDSKRKIRKSRPNTDCDKCPER